MSMIQNRDLALFKGRCLLKKTLCLTIIQLFKQVWVKLKGQFNTLLMEMDQWRVDQNLMEKKAKTPAWEPLIMRMIQKKSKKTMMNSLTMVSSIQIF